MGWLFPSVFCLYLSYEYRPICHCVSVCLSVCLSSFPSLTTSQQTERDAWVCKVRVKCVYTSSLVLSLNASRNDQSA